jgi:hypothetical protein
VQAWNPGEAGGGAQLSENAGPNGFPALA